MNAMDIIKNISIMGMTVLLVVFTSACSDDNDNLIPTTDSIAGEWICCEQEWFEDGEYDKKVYGNDGGILTLKEDGKGSLEIKNYESILEIGNSQNFSWFVSDGCLITDIYDYNVWIIQSLSKSELVLVMDDDSLKIIAHFKRTGSQQEDAREEKVTGKVLEGRWCLMSYFDEEEMDVPIEWDKTDEDLANGNFQWYVDFNADGTGLKEVGHQMVLGSTSVERFTWRLSGNTIIRDVYGYEYNWTVKSYRGGILTLYSPNSDSYATFKKGRKK